VLNDNSQQLRFTLDGHTGPINALVSLEENLLASASDDNTVKIWTLNQTENLKFTLYSSNGHRNKVYFLVSLGKGQNLLASGSRSEAFIKIWNYKTGTFFNEYNHALNIRALVYLGQHLLASGSINQIIVRDILNKKLKYQIDPKNQLNLLTSLNNNMMASASGNEIKIWNVSNGINENSKLNIKSLSIKSMLSIDENQLAFGTGDGKVMIWRIKNKTDEFKVHSKSVRHLIKSNSWLISGSDDNTISVWSWNVIGIRFCFNSSNGGHTGPINSLVSLSNHSIASGSDDGTIKIWDLTTRSLKFTFDSSNGGHTDKITQLVLLPQRQLASASKDGKIKIWQNFD
jgi:WD40 repeat protein